MNIISNQEATGQHNGREYKGIMIAVERKLKGIARCYLPDEWNEVTGMMIATNKVRIKYQKARIVDMKHLLRYKRGICDRFADAVINLELKLEAEVTLLDGMKAMLKET